jgi:hypothetical protein
MSDTTPPPLLPEQPYGYVPPPPEPRSGCATAFMVVFGVILLLPGLCAVIIAAGSIQSSSFDVSFLPYLLLGLLVAFAGVMLIRAATKGS